ncbi:MAG: 4'-phosphopantetheinyl transferase superfamily protein [Candidatus Gracilibacteria bacterium]|nr:4'-phosphopantetheinyl transferase superfamily protein [Candidatus Gracilibacteria bacterium]
MQYFSYNISTEIIELAEIYFPTDYTSQIQKKHTYEQSLGGRYLVSKIVEENWGVLGFLPRVDEGGKPVSEGGFFWSISHSQDHVYVGVSGNPIGVDIEVIRTRDESLFGTFSEQEWNILGEKNWESFYILWSAKEALVKRHLGGVDDVVNWQLVKVEGISEGMKRLFFTDGGSREAVYSEAGNEIVMSICG